MVAPPERSRRGALHLSRAADRPTAEAYAHAAWLLKAETRAMLAVADVESGPEGGFLDSGEPVILFERHLFERLTDGRFAGQAVPNTPRSWGVISSPVAGGYGPVSVQHQKLQFAVTLHREAALKSCSWGLFQILGLNYEAAGFRKLQEFVTAMYGDIDDHLRAFVFFIHRDPRLVAALRSRDWAAFARYYNGPAYARNKYDFKLADAYERLGETVKA